jgi:hypothetical protein
VALSIIIPSIRPIGLQKVINTIDRSLEDEWNLIVVSPEKMEIKETPLMNSYINITDKGSPARCLQIGVNEVHDEIFTWITDDALYLPKQLRKCVERLSTKKESDGIIIKYTEGKSLKQTKDFFFVAKSSKVTTHPGINPNWRVAPIGMFYTSYFKSLGGIDCRFDHINLTIHDFVFRLQRDGGNLHYSPGIVFHCSASEGKSHRPIEDADRRDFVLFQRLYKDYGRERDIDFDNWKIAPSVWGRFKCTCAKCLEKEKHVKYNYT